MGAAVAYDTQRQRVVLIATSFPRLQVWEMDPATGVWENRTPCVLPPSWPPAREEVLIGYDPSRGRTVMFGRTGQSPAWEVWEWEGVTGAWQMRSADFPISSGPDLLETGSQLEYDPKRKTMVLPGWTLWDWDGAQATWTARWHAPIEYGAAPGGGDGGWRTEMSFGYDPDRSSLFVFGGVSGTTDQILYEYDGAAWTDRTPSPLPASWPSPRGGALMFYEPTTQRMVVAGGCDGQVCATDQFWAWAPSTGTWLAGPPPSPGWPASSQAFACPAGIGRAILFNNEYADDPWLGPAAIWDLTTTERRDLRLGHVPIKWPIAPMPGGTYDPTRQRVVMFGGANDLTTFVSNANLLEWNGHDGTWADRTPNDLAPADWPPPREQPGMAADSRRGRVLMFGGRQITPGGVSGPGQLGLADLWEWDGAAGTWTARPAPSGAVWPGSGYGLAMTYDEPRDQMLLIGTGDGDPWAWSPATLGWTPPPTSSGYIGDVDELWLSYDLARGRAMLTIGQAAVLSEWDGAARTWSTLWPTIPVTVGPAAWNVSGAATDPIAGVTWFASPTSVWAWNGATKSWSDHSAPGAAALPWDHRATMVFDESRGTLVLLAPGFDVDERAVLHLYERAVP